MTIPLGPPSPAASSDDPKDWNGSFPPCGAPSVCLAPDGVCRACAVTGRSGGLLPHRFTLACALRPSAVCFLWHFPSRYRAQALPGIITLWCPEVPQVETTRGHPAPDRRLQLSNDTPLQEQKGFAPPMSQMDALGIF